MKHLITYRILVLFLSSCQLQTPPTNRVYYFDQEKLAITIPISFNDTLHGDVFFDTGVSDGYMVLDSTFCANNAFATWNARPDYMYSSTLTGWDGYDNPQYQHKHYKTPTNVFICNDTLTYDNTIVRNQQLSSKQKLIGTIGFPKNDLSHIWEFNFENNYLEIHNSKDFNQPQNCYWLSYVYIGSRIGVTIPMVITTPDMDTVTIDHPYMIDTGLEQDFVLLPSAKEFQFFDKRNDAVLINRGFGGYRSRYNVKATVFGDFNIDSMRIYTDEFAPQLGKYTYGLIGLNFLKRFNVFFDFSRRLIGFKPINNYSRIVNPSTRKYYFSFNITSEGDQIISAIPTHLKDNPYKKAGLLVGDKIIAVNGFKLKDGLSIKEKEEISKNIVRELIIIRNGNQISITAYLNEEDLKGE